MFEGIRFAEFAAEYKVFSRWAGVDFSFWAGRSFPDPYDRRSVL